MRRLVAIAALLLAVPLFACPWACAQRVPAGFDVFAEFGPSCLYGPIHSSATGEAKCEAGRLFAGARLRLTRHDAVELSYSYSPDIFDESYPLYYENGRLYSHSLNYVRYLSTNPHLQPFGTGGVGWETFRGGGLSGSRVLTGDTEFAWNYGVGIDVIPQRYFAVRFQFREYLGTTIPVFHSSPLHNIVPSIGIAFRFNRNRKL
jgi:hypothetical protein